MKNLVFSFLPLLFLFLVGCATLRGMGEDLQSLGRGLKKTVSENEGGSDRKNR